MNWVTAKRLFLFMVLIAVTLWFMRLTVPDAAEPTSLESSRLRDVLAPVQKGLTWLSRQAHFAVTLPVNAYRSAGRTHDLEQEVARLESQLARMNEYILENQRLAELLACKQAMEQEHNLITASVIARDPSNWFATLTINRGSRDNVRENMTVLTPQGLVGRVVSVSPSNCEVLLISDPRSGVGSLVQETRTPGIVEGTVGSSGMARMIHIPKNEILAEGQAVITSGLGSVFPKGIPVGTLGRIRDEPTGLFKSAEIKPYANLDKLEEVLIILDTFSGAGEAPEGG
ncbi:MAG: Cell shape-determining protein MreC precursor [Firmicutes bacterium ADurb.Bin456]|nr:MAG: Cell shape-determining protein MreC precursor [Firmicutes bacterium ADurb.Bin456]